MTGEKILEVLGDIGKILAEGVRQHPFLAAIVLVLLIVAIILLLFRGRDMLGLFIFLACFCIVSIVVIFYLQVQAQKQRNTKLPTVTVRSSADTTRLVDRLTLDQKRDLLTALRGATHDVAEDLNISMSLVRANLFGVNKNGQMKMLRNLTFNMNREEELSVSIPVGYGSTGRSFQSGKANIAIFREDWGKDVIEDEELRKVHPDLRWIISVPVLGTGSGAGPIWVLNVDGLKEGREEKELLKALGFLFNWSYMVSLIISTNQKEISVLAKKPVVHRAPHFASVLTLSKVSRKDVALPTSRFSKLTRDLATLTSLNAFTSAKFSEQVKLRFASSEQ